MADKRELLLSDPDRLGYGGSATGGTNYVYVSTEQEFLNAIEVDNNYVCIDPSLSNSTMFIDQPADINGNNITVDGSEAPGFVLSPDYAAGYPINSPLLNTYDQNNVIISCLTLDGQRSATYDPNHPSYNVGALNIRSTNVWVSDVEITEFWDDGVIISRAGDFVTLSGMNIHDTDKGVLAYYPTDGNRHITIHCSILAGAQRNPYNTGASEFHVFNTLIQDSRFGAMIVGRTLAQNSSGSPFTWQGDAYMISESNFFLNNEAGGNPEAMDTYNTGFIDGHIWSSGDILNGDPANGDVTSPPTAAPFVIPYNYDLVTAAEVPAKVSQAGPRLKPVYTFFDESGAELLCTREPCLRVGDAVALGTQRLTATCCVGDVCTNWACDVNGVTGQGGSELVMIEAA